MDKTKIIRRARVTFVLFICAAIIFVSAVVRVQFFDEDSYAAGKKYRTYEVAVEASRGEILDRNGKPLVTNRQGNRIIFDASSFPSSSEKEQRNTIINSLIKLFESNSLEWDDNLPIIFDDNGSLVFAEDREADIKALKNKNMLNLNRYATAQNCMDALIDMYSLSDYALADARKIASVLYEMWRTGYSVSNPFVFAEDVPNEIVSIILENSDLYTGVKSEVVTYREYGTTPLASHILGIVGVINDTEYENAKKKNEELLSSDTLTAVQRKKIEVNAYSLNDDIGKFGIESVMEEYLRGQKGIKTVSIDTDSNVSEEYTIPPVQGNTVVTTIDSTLQSVAQTALENRILELTAEAGLEAAGAVVVLNVNTGEVLASASYPTYNLAEYYDKYDELAKNPASPLWNRVLQSTYEPGSTMKPVMAVAGLESGTINKDSKFFCGKVFDYHGQEFGCLGSHGNINVVSALEVSCNIFFYNLADLMGIDILNDYSRRCGLGSKTGVELPEASGILAGKAYRESVGQKWYSGDTIQAAIGQSDNQFTLMQMVNYCATIANNGTRYTPHFVKSVVTYDYSDTVSETGITVAQNTGVAQNTINIVKEGMYDVANYGSCASAFSPLQYKVAAKTGTTQIKKIVNGSIVNGNNGFIMCFGPYEAPEIAIAVVVENVNSGTATAKVAADIFEYYFSSRSQVSAVQQINSILN